jgi:tRNA threonylcarbamoyladenosine biosynthesis protein TsaB
MILSIETATNICSVALCNKDGEILLKESNVDKSHASLLSVLIMELFDENGISASDLEAVAVSMGPGSYTGLRIGVSVAKGITYASNLPLIAISTIESMYHGVCSLPQNSAIDLFCPMLDARRMEVYTALFSAKGELYREVSAEIIDNSSFLNELETSKILFFGNGAEKCRELITHPNAYFDSEYLLSAASMAAPAFKALSEKRFVDNAYFEPYYLKDFIATTPRKSLLNG